MSCLQESEELPRDFTALFDHNLHQLDTAILPDSIKYGTYSTKKKAMLHNSL